MAIEEVTAGRLSLRDYLRSIHGSLESAIFSWEDPMPGILDLPLFAYAAGKRVLQSIGG
jgi:predicted ATP-grasp superfamily ATP-dependent carboligase